MKKDKVFDAVEMMRSIRSRLQERYEKDPDSRRKSLMQIRRKYRTRLRRNTLANT